MIWLLFAVIVIAGVCTVFVLALIVCWIYFHVDKRQMRKALKDVKPSTEWAAEEE
jgi:hypothetical protein